MTESREAASALPLAVTCAPDARLADAVIALAGRIGTLAVAPEAAVESGPETRAASARSFTAAVQDLVRWLVAHRDVVAGDVTLVFDRHDDRLLGEVSWAASGSSPTVPPPSEAPGVVMACDVAGADVRCRISAPAA